MCAENLIYLRSNKATNWEKPGKFVSFFLKRLSSNLGYEKAFPDLHEWLIEFDDDGMPDREIGLDESGAPILAGPNERNYGFWLDTNMTIDDFEKDVIDKEYFESKWYEFYGNDT